jgi:hypothetical protein
MKKLVSFFFFVVVCGCMADVSPENGQKIDKVCQGESETVNDEVLSILTCLETLCYGHVEKNMRNLAKDVDVFLESAFQDKDISTASMVLGKLVYQVLKSDRFDSKTKRMLSSHIMGYMVRRGGTSLNLLDDEYEGDEGKSTHDLILRYAKWSAVFALLFIYGYAVVRLTESVVQKDKNLKIKVLGFEVRYGGGGGDGDDDGDDDRSRKIPAVVINNSNT